MNGREDVLRRIRALGVIAVVRAATAEEALRRVEALRGGGLPLVEITLTVPGAIDVIRRLAGDATLLVGAGSVLDAQGADACIEAGARFVVSPALDVALVAACRARNVVVMPGALTPGEIVAAARAGADFVKVFPAGALGGPAYIRALKGPLPGIELVPTGGVTLANVASFIESGAAAVGVGAELVGGPLAEVGAKARAFLDAVRDARGAAPG